MSVDLRSKSIYLFAPMLILKHACSDEQAIDFFEQAVDIQNKIGWFFECIYSLSFWLYLMQVNFPSNLDCSHVTGVPIAHETHRMRILYSPWHTLRLMPKLPAALRFTADIR